MSASGRFQDWTMLSKTERTAATAIAAGRARRLEPQLRAFVEIQALDIDSSGNGRLALMPYAAKDIFVTADHRPQGGLAGLLDFDLRLIMPLGLSVLNGLGLARSLTTNSDIGRGEVSKNESSGFFEGIAICHCRLCS
jgi:hypothetical protein